MEDFKTKDIILLLLPNWKKLLMVLIISLLVGLFISSPIVMKPLYKSYAVVYPVNLSPSSEESNTEQLLQWLHSEEVKKGVTDKFKLYEHYNIDTLNPKHVTYFDLKYKELVTINATQYESIEITVKDESPKMAQQIVYGIIEAVNELITNIKRERLAEYIANNKLALTTEIREVDSVKTLIDNIRKDYNIVDFNSQTKILLKKMHKSGGKGLNESENKTLSGLTRKVTEVNTLSNIYDSQLGTYNYFRNEVNKYKFELNSRMSFTNIISKPILPDSKCFPIRSLIVTIITLSSLIFASIIIVFLNFKKQKVD